MSKAFDFEKYEEDCKALVKQLHEVAETMSGLGYESRQYIGGRLVAKELSNNAIVLYQMEDHFRNEVFEIGEDE